MNYSEHIIYKIKNSYIKFSVVSSKEPCENGILLPFNHDELAIFINNTVTTANQIMKKALTLKGDPNFTLEENYTTDNDTFKEILLSLFHNVKKTCCGNKKVARDISFNFQLHPLTTSAKEYFDLIQLVSNHAKADLVVNYNEDKTLHPTKSIIAKIKQSPETLHI